MKTMKSLLMVVSAFAALTLASPSAHALLPKLALVGGVNQALQDGGGTGWTAGGRVGMGLAGFELDLGVQYLSRTFDTIDNIGYLEIPAMIRFPIMPMFSLGAGYFYDIELDGVGENISGLRAAAKLDPTGLPVFFEVDYNHSLTPGSTGASKDLQVLLGFGL